MAAAAHGTDVNESTPPIGAAEGVGAGEGAAAPDGIGANLDAARNDLGSAAGHLGRAGLEVRDTLVAETRELNAQLPPGALPAIGSSASSSAPGCCSG